MVNLEMLEACSSALAKTIKCYDEKHCGSHGDHPKKRRPSIVSAEENKLIEASEIAS